ncbi:putative DUF6594 domain-containing protein [Seiridium cardinale]
MVFATEVADSDVEAYAAPSNIPQLREILCNPGDDALLRQQISQIDGDKVTRTAILSFRALQLHRIAKLQAELIKKQNNVINPNVSPFLSEEDEKPSTNPDTEDRKIDDLLQRYANAVRNYETLSQSVEFDKRITYDFLGGKQAFNVIGRTNQAQWDIPQWAINSRAQLATLPPYSVGPLGFRELDKGRQNRRNVLERIKSRLHMAVFGGTAMILPVIIMTLVNSLTATLVTASVATMIFAFITVVLATDANGKDVLASTAAYAAIMVVFIGTSLQNSS